MKMKPQLQRTCQNIEDVRTAEHPSRKTAAVEWSCPKRQAVCAAHARSGEAGLPKSFVAEKIAW